MDPSTSPQSIAQVLLDDADLIQTLGFDWTSEQTHAYLEKIPKHFVKRLANHEMPVPQGVWCAEDQKTKDEWDEVWEKARFADIRKGKKSGNKKTVESAKRTEVIDRSKFAHVVRRGESGLFFDQDTKELVFLKLTGMVASREILEAMNSVCKAAARERRNVRRDDPGMYVDIGYTNGPRNNRNVQLSASLLAKKSMTPVEQASIHMREAGIGAVAWNVMKPHLPTVVVNDYNDTILKAGLNRMDGGLKEGLFSLWTEDGQKEYRFSSLEAAPTRGGCAMNYCRFCHNETGKNEYGLAITTVSTALPHRGGNFFVAQYGILSEAEENAVTCWRVRDYHGTTLYQRVPRQNSGVAFFVPISQAPDVGNAAPFTHNELANTKRPPFRGGRRKGGSVPAQNEWWLREPTPEKETEDAGASDSREEVEDDVLIGEDGSTAMERMVLDAEADALAEEWEAMQADGVEDDVESEDDTGNEDERPVKRRKFIDA